MHSFWGTIKYQHIYLNPAKDRLDLYLGIKKRNERYHNRDHQGIDNYSDVSLLLSNYVANEESNF